MTTFRYILQPSFNKIKIFLKLTSKDISEISSEVDIASNLIQNLF